jgi:hypothetical protein
LALAHTGAAAKLPLLLHTYIPTVCFQGPVQAVTVQQALWWPSKAQRQQYLPQDRQSTTIAVVVSGVMLTVSKRRKTVSKHQRQSNPKKQPPGWLIQLALSLVPRALTNIILAVRQVEVKLEVSDAMRNTSFLM